MQVAVVLGIEQYDVVVVDDGITLLPVVVPLIYEEGDTLGRWLMNQLYLLTSPVDLRCLLGVLKIHA